MKLNPRNIIWIWNCTCASQGHSQLEEVVGENSDSVMGLLHTYIYGYMYVSFIGSNMCLNIIRSPIY